MYNLAPTSRTSDKLRCLTWRGLDFGLRKGVRNPLRVQIMHYQFVGRMPQRERLSNEDVTFDIHRMRASVQSGHVVVPSGLTADEVVKWICEQSGKNVTDRPTE